MTAPMWQENIDSINTSNGAPTDAAVTNVALSASQVALLKGIISQLQNGGTSGTQYTDGAVAPAHPIGTEIAFNNAGTMTAVSAASPLPITGSISASNPSVGTDGSAIPTSSTLLGGSDGTNLQPLQVDGSKNLKVIANAGTNLNTSTLALESGGHLATIDTVQGATADSAVVGDNTGTISAKLRGLTKIFNDVWDSVNHRFHVNVDNANANGQSTMANSAPVAIASDQSAIATKQADTFGNATNITAATTFSGVTTISQIAANSSVLLTNPGNSATFTAEINVASAFIGTLSFYGLEPDGATLQLIAVHQRNTTTIANNTAINTGSALNQSWTGSSSAFKAIYVVCTAFTSGTVSVQLGYSAAPYALTILNTVPFNLSQVLGAALSPSNPNISEDNIRNWIRAGNGFIYSCANNLATATNNNLTVCSLSVFNPAASGKNILIYSIQTLGGGANAISQLRATTTDPSGGTGFTGTGMTASNAKPGAGASVASLSASATGITASPTQPGTFLQTFGMASNAVVELLTNGATIMLPSGVANGIAVMQFVPTAAQVFGCIVKAIEF